MFRSDDRREDWSKTVLFDPSCNNVDLNIPEGSVTDLVADPANNRRFYAAVRGAGVFRSIDGGIGWVLPINAGLSLVGDGVDNDGSGTVDDAGETAAGAGRIVLAANANNAYAALISAAGRLMGVFQWTDPPGNWSLLGTAPAPLRSADAFIKVRGSPRLRFLDTNPDTIVRLSGKWADDRFVDGQSIRIEGSGLNDGAYTIEKVIGDTLQLSTANALTPEGPVAGVSVFGMPRFFFLDTNPDTITRTFGSWATDGFMVGQQITVSGAGVSDGTYTINRIRSTGTPNDTLELIPTDQLMPQPGSVAGVRITAEARTLPSLSGRPQLDFTDEAPLNDTITRFDGTSWLADGFRDGDRVAVSGSLANNGTYTIAAIENAINPGDTLRLVAGDALTPEADTPNVFIAVVSAIEPQVNLNPSGQGAVHFSIAADAAGNVFIGGDSHPDNNGNLYWWNNRPAANGGQVWEPIVLGNANGTAPHADSRAMVFDRFGDLLEGDDGGLYRLIAPTQPTLRGNPRLTFNNANHTIARDAGSWRDDGFDEADERFAWQQVVVAIRPGDGNTTAAVPLNSDADPQFDQVRRYTMSNSLRTLGSRIFDANGQMVPGTDNLVLLRGARTDTLNFAAANVNPGTDQIAIAGHGLVDGAGPFWVDSDGTLPIDLFASAQYWVHVVDPNNIQLATSRGAAVAATVVNITTPGSGADTLNNRFNGLDLADRNTFTAGFHRIPYVVNAVDSTRMLIGLRALYGSTSIGAPMAPQYDGLDTVSRIWLPPERAGVFFSALAYGGRKGGIGQANVVYAARGNEIFVALPTGGGALGAFQTERIDQVVQIRDLVLDPDNYDTAYAVADSAVYKRTAPNKWVLISEQLNNADLQTIEFVNVGGQQVLLVGGATGVYRAFDPGPGAIWTEFGRGLPNALVTDLSFIHRPAAAFENPHGLPRGDVLLAATLGRGAWTIQNADTFLDDRSVITIQGTAVRDFVELARNVATPSLLDVIVNGNIRIP